jgi:ribosomal protein L7Ae-like RNA K-turn-binding protein
MDKLVLLPKSKGMQVVKIKEKEAEKYEEEILTLKKAVLAGVVSKGIKETLKNLEANKCKKVYLSVEADDDTYKKCVKEYCELYGVPVVEVNEKYLIRDTVLIGKPSEIIINEARVKGKTPKVMPNCYVAGIIDYGNVNTRFSNDD